MATRTHCAHRYFAPLAKYFTVCITYQPAYVRKHVFCQSRLQVFFAALQYQVNVILGGLLSIAECSCQSALFVLLFSNFSTPGDRPDVGPSSVVCVQGLAARTGHSREPLVCTKAMSQFVLGSGKSVKRVKAL